MKQKDIDNILKSNKKLDWVKRLYEKDTPSIVLPGQEYPSTHYMESSDNLVYPTIIRNADGKLEYLGNKARDYAIKTNTAIKFDTEEDAAWFGENYKQGTDVLKEFKKGGKITAETIYSVSKQPKVVLTPNDIYAKDGAKIDLSGTSGNRQVFSLDEFKNIVPDYQYQGYLNSGKEGLYKNIDKSKYPVLVDTLPDGSVTYRPYSYESAETSYEDYKKLSQSDQPIKATPIKTFAGGGMMGGGQGGGNGAGMIMQGVTQAIGGIFSTLDAQKKATEQQGQQNLQNAYQMQQINDLKAMELEQQQPQPYNKGGIVQAWIQKFVTGGQAQQLNYPTTQYPNWYMNQEQEFKPYSQYNVNPQLNNNAQIANTSVPNIQTNFPQNIGTNYQTSANASQDQINKDNKMADEMMGKTPMDKPKGGGFMSTMQDYGKAVDAIGSTMGDFSNRNGDVRNSAWQTAKKGAAESNPVFGFFHGIDEGLQSIGKMAGGNKGQKGVQFFTDPIGFIMNLGSGIKEREDKKREQQLEYDDRNKMPTIKEPSHYGNYHAKYGSNIKNMEQRVIDDIYSDFDKYMKLNS